jgi:fructose-1,6-bisphosphatase
MRILEKIPQSLHERTPLVVGSKAEVARVMKYMEMNEDKPKKK